MLEMLREAQERRLSEVKREGGGHEERQQDGDEAFRGTDSRWGL